MPLSQISVPQFLDVEDTIIGPITIRQFLEMMVGGLIIFILFKVCDFALFVFLTLVVGMATLVLAFLRPNGQGFHYFLLNFFATLKSPKLKVWKKQVSLKTKSAVETLAEKKSSGVLRRRSPLTSSKLSELSLIVDTGGVYRGEDNGAPAGFKL